MAPGDHPTSTETSWIRNGARVAPEGAGTLPGNVPAPQCQTVRRRLSCPAFPVGSVSENPTSPSVLHEANERAELAPSAWMTSQDSTGAPSRLARVSTRTSMRLETEISSGEVAATTLRNGAMTINNETVADFTFRPPSDPPERTGRPAWDRTMSARFPVEMQREPRGPHSSTPHRATRAVSRFRVRLGSQPDSRRSTPLRANPNTTRRRFPRGRGLHKGRHSPGTQRLESARGDRRLSYCSAKGQTCYPRGIAARRRRGPHAPIRPRSGAGLRPRHRRRGPPPR